MKECIEPYCTTRISVSVRKSTVRCARCVRKKQERKIYEMDNL